MKKYIGICSAIVLIGFLTGCGSKSKTLTCSKDDKATGMSMNQKVDVDFKGKDVTKMTIVETVTVEDSYKSYMDELKNAFESQFASYNDKKGISMDTKTDGNKIKITIAADFKNMDEEAKKTLDIVNTTADYNEMKKAFENQSYKCK